MAAQQRRFFVLPEPLAASHIPLLTGRVVLDKLSPLDAYAPFEAGVLPNDLTPAPLTWRDRNDFFSRSREWSVGGGLADLVSLSQSRGDESATVVHGGEVRVYRLENSARVFQRLMEDVPAYASDVRELLRQRRGGGAGGGGGDAYFVTGFLTATNGTLSSYSVKTRSHSSTVTVPLLQILGSPLPAGNPQVTPGFSTGSHAEKSMRITEEVIFAVCYDVVRTRRSLDWEAERWIKTTIKNKGPKRVKTRHATYSAPMDFRDRGLDLDLDLGGNVAGPEPEKLRVALEYDDYEEIEVDVEEDDEEIALMVNGGFGNEPDVQDKTATTFCLEIEA